MPAAIFATLVRSTVILRCLALVGARVEQHHGAPCWKAGFSSMKVATAPRLKNTPSPPKKTRDAVLCFCFFFNEFVVGVLVLCDGAEPQAAELPEFWLIRLKQMSV